MNMNHVDLGFDLGCNFPKQAFFPEKLAKCATVGQITPSWSSMRLL